MGTCVADGIRREVVRQEEVLLNCFKSKLEDFHAWEVEIIP